MKTKLLLCILILAGFLRLFELGNVPHGFTNDEIVAVYNAYSLWQTHGYGIDNTFFPLNFNGLSPVPIYINALFIGIFGLSPFVARLPYALSSIATAILLFLLVKRLCNNSFLSFFVGLVFVFSPWDFIMSRGAWETNFAIFFYLLGIYFFIQIHKKGTLLWSLFPFILGFYSYNATKIFFLAFLPCLVWIYQKELFKKKNELLTFSVGIFLLVLSFVFVLQTNAISRVDTFILKDTNRMQNITNMVNVDRAKSSAPGFLKEIYTNKALSLGKEVADNYVGFFSPQYLFLFGDVNKANGYGRFFWGQMYLIELPLLLYGLFFMLSRQFSKGTKVFLAGLLCSPLASAVTSTTVGTDYFFRSGIAIPFLSFFVGSGAYYLYEYVKSRSEKFIKISGIIMGIFYIFFISKFLYNYYFQFTTYGGEYWSVSSRTISHYIWEQKDTHKAIYILTLDKELALQYGFFNKISPYNIQRVWTGNKENIDTVYFISTCSALKSIILSAPLHSLFISDASCIKNKKSIYTVLDTIEPLQTIWQVYEN